MKNFPPECTILQISTSGQDVTAIKWQIIQSRALLIGGFVTGRDKHFSALDVHSSGVPDCSLLRSYRHETGGFCRKPRGAR